MAALTLADELAEASKKLQAAWSRSSPPCRRCGAQSAERTKATQAAIVAAFNSAAERIERWRSGSTSRPRRAASRWR